MNRRTLLLSGAAALGSAALPAAAGAQFLNGRFQQQLTIGVNVPLSGDRADSGIEIANGVQAALDEVNRVGGTFGTAFAMRTFDDMDALAQSIVNVQFAAADATTLALVGGFDGSLITASLSSYESQQMPLLVPGSTADSVTARGYRNVFRLPTKDSLEGQFAAQFIAGRDRPASAIAITQDGDYGPDVAQGFLNAAKAAHLAADVYTFAEQRPDYPRAAAEVFARKPDYLYLCGATSALGPIVPALRTAGYTGKFGASQGFFNETALSKYGQAFTGGVISTSFAPLDLAPDVAGALSDFRLRYPLTALSAFGYAAAQVIVSAVRRTGARNRLTTLTALQTPSSYNTIAGTFRFAPTGDPIDPLVYFYTVADAKFKFIAPSHATPFVL